MSTDSIDNFMSPYTEDGKSARFVVQKYHDRVVLAVKNVDEPSNADQSELNNRIGATGEVVASTDTAVSGLNGLIKRLLQRFTALIGLFPTSLSNGNFKVSIQESTVTQAVTVTGGATAANQTAIGNAIGATNETAPNADTATAGLNGRLQRIAQRIGSLVALFPTALGQQTRAGSFAVTLANDHADVGIGIVGGRIVSVTATLTRPTGGLSYFLGQVVAGNSTPVIGNVLTFPVARISGGSGTVTGAVLTTSTNHTLKSKFRLLLFNISPTVGVGNSIIQDGTALSLTDTDNNNCIGVIDFPSSNIFNAGAGANGNLWYRGMFVQDAGYNRQPGIDFITSNSPNLYGVLLVLDNLTALSGETYQIRLDVRQN